MPLLIILIVLVGILSGVVYGTSHWQQFGTSVVGAALWGGAAGAGVSGVFMILLYFFHSLGRSLEWFFGAMVHARFWFQMLVGSLIASSIVNLILSSVASGSDTRSKWAVLRPDAEKLFQDPLSINWVLWFEGLAVFWPWFLVPSLIVGFLAVLTGFDTPTDEHLPWYGNVLAVLGLLATAFPPTFYLAVYAYVALVAIGFGVIVLLLIWSVMKGSPKYFVVLHRNPFPFAIFYSAIGGASGTYFAVQTSILGTQAANSPQMIALGFAFGAVFVLILAFALRSIFRLGWEPVFK